MLHPPQARPTSTLHLSGMCATYTEILFIADLLFYGGDQLPKRRSDQLKSQTQPIRQRIPGESTKIVRTQKTRNGHGGSKVWFKFQMMNARGIPLAPLYSGHPFPIKRPHLF